MNWSDITLKQFCQLSVIDKEDGDSITKAIKRLKVLNIEPDTSSLGNLLAQIPEFLNKLPSEEVRQVYSIGGQDFHPFVNFTTMHPSRFLDIHNYVKDKNPDNPQNWPMLLSFCLSKHGEPYDYQTHIDRENWLYENMTFDQVYPLMVFFSKVWTILQGIILDSSTERLHTQVQELIQTLNENIGSSQSIGAGSHTSAK